MDEWRARKTLGVTRPSEQIGIGTENDIDMFRDRVKTDPENTEERACDSPPISFTSPERKLLYLSRSGRSLSGARRFSSIDFHDLTN